MHLSMKGKPMKPLTLRSTFPRSSFLRLFLLAVLAAFVAGKDRGALRGYGLALSLTMLPRRNADHR